MAQITPHVGCPRPAHGADQGRLQERTSLDRRARPAGPGPSYKSRTQASPLTGAGALGGAGACAAMTSADAGAAGAGAAMTGRVRGHDGCGRGHGAGAAEGGHSLVLHSRGAPLMGAHPRTHDGCSTPGFSKAAGGAWRGSRDRAPRAGQGEVSAQGCVKGWSPVGWGPAGLGCGQADWGGQVAVARATGWAARGWGLSDVGLERWAPAPAAAAAAALAPALAPALVRLLGRVRIGCTMASKRVGCTMACSLLPQWLRV